jgi:hypothetical protein
MTAVKQMFTSGAFNPAMTAHTLIDSPSAADFLSPIARLRGVVMRYSRWDLARQLFVAVTLSAAAVAAMLAAAGKAGAADLAVVPEERVAIAACAEPREIVVLYDKEGRPTVPARTPYYYCVTGTTLLPGKIPPPPEYCCD